MKKITIFSIMFCLFGFNVYSQCWNNINTITTNTEDPLSANSFDWTKENAIMYLKKFWNSSTNSCPPQSIKLPMWSQFLGVFNNKNLLTFQSESDPSKKDQQPNDGWELLSKEFGQSGAYNEAVDNPYYALYNRYTGKIRLFYCLVEKDPTLSVGGITLSLEFQNSKRKTSLMQHLEPIAQPIKSFTPDNTFRVANYIAQEDVYWFYADFEVAYDPCTCVLKAPSFINFKLENVSVYTLDASINGQLISSVVSPTTSGIAPSSTESNSAVAGDLGQIALKAGKKGVDYYNSWEKTRKDLDKTLDQFDGYVKSKINSELNDKYPTGIDINGVHYNSTVDDFKKTSEGVKKLLGNDYNPNELKLIKSFTKLIPYVGFVWGAYEFLSADNSKGKEKVQTPPANTLTDVKLKMTGTLTKNAIIADRSIYTPGSKSNTASSPIYNNILGVVNILDIPKFEFVEYAPKMENPAFNSTLTSDGFISKIRSYRFSDDIKYVLNPASNLELLSADASIVLEFGEKAGLTFDGHNSSLRDVDQMPVEFGNNFSPSFKIDSPQVRMENAGWDIEYLSKGYFDNLNTNKNQKGIFRIRTPYTSLSCIKNVVFSLFNHFDTERLELGSFPCCRNKLPKIMLKVIFTLKKIGEESLEEGLYHQIITFDLTDQLKTAKKFETTTPQFYLIQSFIANGQDFHFAKGFENQPIWPSIIAAPSILNLSNVSITQDVYAQKEIIINDNVTIADGVTLYAGEKITTNSTFHSPSNGNVIYNIGKGFYCRSDLSAAKATDEYITNICNSDAYKTRSQNKLSMKPDNDTSSVVIPNSLEAYITKNEYSGNYDIITNIKGVYEIVILDMSSKIIKRISQESFTKAVGLNYKEIVPFDCNGCVSTGIYFIKIKIGDKHKVMKLLIQ
jgi:hypothetical protein